MAVNLGAQSAHRSHGCGVRELREIALFGLKQTPRGFAQAHFALRNQLTMNHVQGRQDAAPIDAHVKPRLRAETLGAANGAISAHVNDRLLVCINAQAAHTKLLWSETMVGTGLNVFKHAGMIGTRANINSPA